MKIKVMVFANNAVIRKSIIHLLETNGSLVITGVYSNFKRAAYYVKTKLPDVVVVEIDISGTIDIEGINNIKMAMPSVHILIGTAVDDLKDVYNIIKAGASGYHLLNKHLRDNLIDATKEVMTGGAPLSPEIAKIVVHILQKPELVYTGLLKNYHLTSREKEILSLLKDGLSYKMIMAELNIKYETVRSHMKNIYDKLNVSSLTEVVAKVINEKIA